MNWLRRQNNFVDYPLICPTVLVIRTEWAIISAWIRCNSVINERTSCVLFSVLLRTIWVGQKEPNRTEPNRTIRTRRTAGVLFVEAFIVVELIHYHLTLSAFCFQKYLLLQLPYCIVLGWPFLSLSYLSNQGTFPPWFLTFLIDRKEVRFRWN